MAERLLDPFYRSRGCEVERYSDDHWMQAGHVDVAITQPDRGRRKGARHLIEEKIMRARVDGGPARLINLETWSCSVPGHEKEGWFYDDRALCTVLLVCFADAREADLVTMLDCVWMPFAPLKRWFYDGDLGGEVRFMVHTHEDQINRSVSRMVPIEDILGAGIGARRFNVPLVAGQVVYDKDGHLIHFCMCGREASFGEGVSVRRGELGKWYCRQCLPDGWLPS